MFKMFSQTLLLIACLALATPAFAKPVEKKILIPKAGISLKLAFSNPDKQGVLSEKIIQLEDKKNTYRASWLSVEKERDLNAAYPTYQIKANKGVLETPEINNKSTYYHPLMWPRGYVMLGDAFPLWMPPEYLELPRNKRKDLLLGILKVKVVALRGLEEEMYQEILYFRNLYEHYQKEQETSGKGPLKSFNKNFFRVRKLAEGKHRLNLNGSSKELDVVIIGNRYFEFKVLDQLDNPLILGLRIYPKKAPRVFARSFEFLDKNFEFLVTQILFE